MNLTAFHVANFKAIASAQRVPVRPITLIYGANSAGKSSVLHALALTHHAIETGDLDIHGTRIGGESIDLGGFRQYVHRRERDREVELRFELDPRRLSGRMAELLRSARQTTVELSIGERIARGKRRLDPDRGSRIRVGRLAVDVNGTPLLSMSAREGGILRLDRLDHGHPIFRELLRRILVLATTTQHIRQEDFVTLAKEIDALVPNIIAESSRLFPRIEEEVDKQKSERESWDALVPIRRGHRQEDIASAARLVVPRMLRDIVGGLGSAIEDAIKRLRYLGPLRSYPPRHLAFSQHHDPNWFAGGGYAWDVVRRNEDVRRRVNTWLGDPERLQTPYELVVRELIPSNLVAAELPLRLSKEFHDLLVLVLADLAEGELPEVQLLAEDFADRLELARNDDAPHSEYTEITDLGPFPEIQELVASRIDTDNLSRRWSQKLVESQQESLRDLLLIDQRTNIAVSHRDVGIGVSQVLPVLVAAYASKNNLLAIEQPEIHLHPALQAELGDVFLGSALGANGNTFLIETHSEHLILRILRRIRETTDGELPEGVPTVRPEQVAVLYVQPRSRGVEILPIPITPDGEFDRAWPNGFFAERAEELF